MPQILEKQKTFRLKIMDLTPEYNLFNQPEIKSFHNTIMASGSELDMQESKAKGLEAFIVSVLKKGVEYSPYDVLEICLAMGKKTKENSVRRALSNLKDKYGLIELTGNRVLNNKYSNVPNGTIRLK